MLQSCRCGTLHDDENTPPRQLKVEFKKQVFDKEGNERKIYLESE